MPSLGYLIDHPLAEASIANPHRWDLTLLMAGVPTVEAPDHYLHPGFPDLPLDQDGVGACVAFAGETIQNANESEDEGADLFNSASAFVAYDWLKHGHGTFPGDGIPNAEGSYPEALWKLALAEGLPDKTGKTHRITAYYSHQFASRVDFLFLQQVILAFGPVNFGIPWPTNWMASPPTPYKMPTPGYFDGAHSITIGGWDVDPDGDWLTGVQTWGRWGGPKGTYRIRADWLYQSPMGPQIMWKTIDAQEAPTPPAPDPEGPMLALVDKVQRLVDSHLGAQVYKLDGSTPLVLIKSGPSNIASAGKLEGDFYLAIVSIGGILQLGCLRAADCTYIRVMTDPTAAVGAEHKRWDDWLLTAPK